MYWTTIATPIGNLLLAGDGERLSHLYMELRRWGPDDTKGWRRSDGLFVEARSQLEAYFAGDLLEFDLAIAPEGTPFQQRVWSALRAIPYGETVSYGDVARTIGEPKAVRAVGAANGRNPISIVIPCHRVVGADGTLIGYGGGLERKRWLLAHETRVRFQRVRPSQPREGQEGQTLIASAGRDGS